MGQLRVGAESDFMLKKKVLLDDENAFLLNKFRFHDDGKG